MTGAAFIFSDQGSQYRGMGADLLIYPVFEQTLRSIDSILRNLGCEWSLLGKASFGYIRYALLFCPEHTIYKY